MADEMAGAGEAPEATGHSDHNMIADMWHEHHTAILIALLGIAVTLYAVYASRRQQQSAGTAGGASGQPGTATPQAMTSDSTSALSNLTGYMQTILQQLQQLGSGASGSGTGSASSGSGSGTGSSGNPTPSPTPAPAPKPSPAPAPAPAPSRYVTVSPWTAQNTPWNSTLWGIAQHEGESLSRIEQLNPQIANPNLIYPGQRVNV